MVHVFSALLLFFAVVNSETNVSSVKVVVLWVVDELLFDVDVDVEGDDDVDVEDDDYNESSIWTPFNV